ncbi:class B sortase [Paenibacillus prosopidis]|uniref:SrtB family sortase n=1 Tax=Paenibacillus prosopidis TaxID=630520 RepID=A0A368VPT7_9BACL|nr:class B sortase [Paenibacillus prosopidis]RCW43518.1 SrtB family sortase [Paenibacillus prosopidis]
MKKSIRILLFILSSCLFAYSLFTIVGKAYSYYKENKQYEQLRGQVEITYSTEIASEVASEVPSEVPSKVPSQVPSQVPSEAPVVEVKPIRKMPYTILNVNPDYLDEKDVLKEYSNLYKQNSDLVGWIQMPGFKVPIDYPVMQADDNEYYLKRDFKKKSSFAGSIFMDYINNPQMDMNIVIYGHAMNDHSMFGNLMNYYARADKYTKHTKIFLNLMNTQFEYEVFSTYAANRDYNYRQTNFSSDDEYLDFLQRIRDKSIYNYNVELTSDDKLITLSTCNNEFGDEYRSVIHAKLIKQIIYTDNA